MACIGEEERVIAWIDLETTCLHPKRGSIVEIAIVLTDDGLNDVAVFESLVRPLSGPRGEMEPYVREMHEKSGLLAALATGDAPRCGEVERTVMEWVCWNATGAARPEIGSEKRKQLRTVPLGGNSVHFDRRWLQEHMDDLEELFSHRNIDISTVTELAKRWRPGIYGMRPGALDISGASSVEAVHRALADVRHSIETARYYRRDIFNSVPSLP
jgi:oligoribonuclease